MKTPGPLPVRAWNGVLDSGAADDFLEEAIPVSTVETSWAEGWLVTRFVVRFVITRFRSWCLLGES